MFASSYLNSPGLPCSYYLTNERLGMRHSTRETLHWPMALAKAKIIIKIIKVGG